MNTFRRHILQTCLRLKRCDKSLKVIVSKMQYVLWLY